MIKKLLIIITVLLSAVSIKAQEVIEISPLFEYPVAPQELSTIQEKCDYLLKNFWNNFNFKKKEPLDQHALNEAFHVYSTSFRYGSAKEVETSVDKLLKSLQGNPMLLLQFTKAAEENLYGPRADFWSDMLYLKFVDALEKNKKISAPRKARFLKQAAPLRTSATGNTAPSFWFEDAERASKQYFPMSTPTLLIFGNPDDTDWRLNRLRLDSNYRLADALNKGKVNILYIIPFDLSNWQDAVSNYNKRWTLGISENVGEVYDTRLNPSIFLIGTDGKIIKKNMHPDDAAEELLQLLNQ